MIHAQPLIPLADVQAGSRWFQQVFGLASGHGGPEYQMLMDSHVMVAQLHDGGVHDQAHIGSAAVDFDAPMQRVSGTNAVVLEGPMLNPNSGQREVWLSGPEGYVVVVAGPAD